MEKNKRHTKKQMYDLIRKWESSGQSKAQFFRNHGISRSTFGYWRKKYIKETGSTNNKSKENFIPVKITNTTGMENGTGVLEVVYPNGVRLVCSSNIDLSRLKPLIVL